MRWLLGFPAIRARLVAASIVVPGLPAQGAALRAPDERRGFDTRASRHPRLHTTRERTMQGETIRGKLNARYLWLVCFLAAPVMANEAGLPLGVPTMVDSKIAGHAEKDRSSIGDSHCHDVRAG